MIDFKKVQGIAFDFDGVFTDNRVIVCQNGDESVICSRFDGLVLSKLKQLNIPITVISTESNVVVKKRCEKLNIPVIYDCSDKKSAFETWVNENHLNSDFVIFMGNDINDYEVMNSIPYTVAVADAVPEILNCAQFVTTKCGGAGAVREICDIIAEHKAKT